MKDNTSVCPKEPIIEKLTQEKRQDFMQTIIAKTDSRSRNFSRLLKLAQDYVNKDMKNHDYITLINGMQVNKAEEIKYLNEMLTTVNGAQLDQRNNDAFYAGITALGAAYCSYVSVSWLKQGTYEASITIVPGMIAGILGYFAYDNTRSAINAHKLAKFYDHTQEKFNQLIQQDPA
jgi:hypothetical protein